MNLPDLFAPGWTAVLVNHLWQSTAVALLAWLLTLRSETMRRVFVTRSG